MITYNLLGVDNSCGNMSYTSSRLKVKLNTDILPVPCKCRCPVHTFTYKLTYRGLSSSYSFPLRGQSNSKRIEELSTRRWQHFSLVPEFESKFGVFIASFAELGNILFLYGVEWVSFLIIPVESLVSILRVFL